MKLVVPGDFLCYSEEYSPGANAFENSEGKVFASTVGSEKRIDASREIAVYSPRVKRALRAGDLVYARVEDLYDTVALLRMRPAATNVAPNSDSAFLRISEIRRGFVESFRGNIGIGDVLVARVKEVTPLGVYLTIIEDSLGVLRAFCSNCRNEMLFTSRGFYCKACAASEQRKTPAASSAPPALFTPPTPQAPRPTRVGRAPLAPPGGGRIGRGERGTGGGRRRLTSLHSSGVGEKQGRARGGRERRGERVRRGGRRGLRERRVKSIGSFYPATP
ncbi:MAG: exosome complex RNA-binding protein Csl4 [Candidatus Norongarragalinales archaeon]